MKDVRSRLGPLPGYPGSASQGPYTRSNLSRTNGGHAIWTILLVKLNQNA